MPPNSDFVTGKPAVQASWQAIMDMGIKEAKLESEVEGHGDTAIEDPPRTRSTVRGGQVLDKGKYILIWKQENAVEAAPRYL